jgi:hypothetical protein
LKQSWNPVDRAVAAGHGQVQDGHTGEEPLRRVLRFLSIHERGA